MYSFKKFLIEGSGEVKTIAEILDECAPFIRESGGRLIYRGLKNPTGALTIKWEQPGPRGAATNSIEDVTAYRMDVRQDRKPLHSNASAHEAIDRYMKNEFGFAGRSQGLFVAGGIDLARAFGTPHIILPRGNFKFLWSPNVTDLLFFQLNDVEGEADIQKIKDLAYQADDLPAAIDSHHEIMIGCKDYYAIPATRDMIFQMKKVMK